MGEPGFWDDPEAAGRVSAEHARQTRRLSTYEQLGGRRRRPRGARRARRGGPGARRPRSSRRSRSRRGAARGARGGAAVLRPLRRRRRARHGQRRRGRDRRPGLGRDGAADGDALGRAPRLRRRAARGQRGGGGRHQVGDLPRLRRERLRPLRGREGRAPARAAVARSTPPTAARRRSRASRSSPVVEEAGEVEIDDDDLQIDTYRASGAGGQHVNKTDSAVRITHRPSGIVVQCQNERSQSSNKATAMTMLRSKLLELEERKRREEIAKEQRRGAGRQLRLADPLLRPAPVHDGQGPPHRLRDGRRPARARRRPRRLRARRPAPAARAAGRPRCISSDPYAPVTIGPGEVVPSEQPTAPYLDAVVGLRLPRLDALPRPGPQGRSRAPTRACAARSARAR